MDLGLLVFVVHRHHASAAPALRPLPEVDPAAVDSPVWGHAADVGRKSVAQEHFSSPGDRGATRCPPAVQDATLGPGRPCQLHRGDAPLGHTRTQQRFELSFSAVKVVHHCADAVRSPRYPQRPGASPSASTAGGPAGANASRYEARTLDFWVWNSASVITPRSFRSASLLSWSALLSCGTTL